MNWQALVPHPFVFVSAFPNPLYFQLEQLGYPFSPPKKQNLVNCFFERNAKSDLLEVLNVRWQHEYFGKFQKKHELLN